MRPLVRLAAVCKLHPNTVSFAGLFISVFAAAFWACSAIRWGGLLLLTGGLMDALDGELARVSGRTSRFGALLDASLDRYAEFALFFGAGAFALHSNDYWTLAAAAGALCGSVMVSYSRARAEFLGFECRIGLFQRPERLLALGIGALLHPLGLQAALWLVALGANFTAVQRLVHAYRQDRR